MASRARAIQRKRIHNLSTAFLVGIRVLALTVAGCAGGNPSPIMSGDRSLAATPPERQLSPGDTGPVHFVLTSGGVPIAGQTVTFSILNAPQAQGATLGASSATTDVSGAVSVDVHAGLATEFGVHATSGSSQADAVIIVAAGATGSVVVAPFFTASSAAAATATGIEIYLFGGQLCNDLSAAHPPASLRSPGNLPPSGGTVRFDVVSTDESSAIVGRALGARGAALATGCVDLPGPALLPDGVVQVALPLRDAILDPVGGFSLTTTLDFAPPLAAGAALSAPWRDLADCPLDPAQLWLDCTVDALSPASAADPLDCVPSTAPGGEGALGDLVQARRGALLVDAAGGVTGCRGARDAGNAVSLDAVAMGLFGSPTPATLVALPAIADDAAHLLEQIVLESDLDVRPGNAAGSYSVTHTLLRARFGPPSTPTVPRPRPPAVELQPLGLPVLIAYPTAEVNDGLLVIGSHGFTLRIGSAARAAFGLSALAPRGLPGDAGGVVATIAGLAHSDDGTANGCNALDAALCAGLAQPPGCLVAACGAGLGALVARLDGAFAAVNGPGLDLQLAGSAPLRDPQGDGNANNLGDPTDPSAFATWSVDLRTSVDHRTFGAQFEGNRLRN